MTRYILVLLLMTGTAAEAACRRGYATPNGCVPYDKSGSQREVESYMLDYELRRNTEQLEQIYRQNQIIDDRLRDIQQQPARRR